MLERPGLAMSRRCVYTIVIVILLAVCQALHGASKPVEPAKKVLTAEVEAKNEEFLRRKAQLFIEKAQKAEKRGEYAEAAEAYEDAYETFPGNVAPLLAWGELLCKIGQYDRAQEVLKRIPLKQLPPGGQACVHLLFGKIAAYAGNLEAAAADFGAALKVQPENLQARLQLALINEHFGFGQRAAELIELIEAEPSFRYRDNLILFNLQVSNGDFIKAFYTSEVLAKQLEVLAHSVEEPPDWTMKFQTFSFLYYLTALPVMLSGVFGLLYALVILALLAFWISCTTADFAVGGASDSKSIGGGIFQGSLLSTYLFIGLGIVHAIVAWLKAAPVFRLALLIDDFSIYDSQWILPRLLIAMHLLCWLLFFVIPVFRLLPLKMRPNRNELYALWFFCWWFMVFVLIFQSRLTFAVRLSGILVSIAIMGFCSFWLPLGKYWIYKFGALVGLDGLVKSSDPATVSSFGEAKLEEAKAASLFESENFPAVIEIGRKLFIKYDSTLLPNLWLLLIRTRIESEDIFESRRLLGEFKQKFSNNTRYMSNAVLLEALLKSLCGDYAGALKAIESIPENYARSFVGDDAALSLLVTGRCMVAFDQGVQAHIAWTRGLDNAKRPLVKAYLTLELALQDYKMSRRDWTSKWAEKAMSLGGGKKTQALAKTVQSIALAAEDKLDDALKIASEAVSLCEHNGMSLYWYGKLLCRKGHFSAAEGLLAKMNAETAAAENLIKEITAKHV